MYYLHRIERGYLFWMYVNLFFHAKKNQIEMQVLCFYIIAGWGKSYGLHAKITTLVKFGKVIKYGKEMIGGEIFVIELFSRESTWKMKQSLLELSDAL